MERSSCPTLIPIFLASLKREFITSLGQIVEVLGEYKVKNDRMKALHSQALDELRNIDDWSIIHVRREYNTRADELSKMGMEKARIEKMEMPG